MKTFSLLGKVPAALFLSCTLLMTSCHSNRKLGLAQQNTKFQFVPIQTQKISGNLP
jgi:hypothetical protein